MGAMEGQRGRSVGGGGDPPHWDIHDGGLGDAGALEAVARRLSALYPAHSVAAISVLLRSALWETSGARVHAFRLVLAEHKVRAWLKQPTARAPGVREDQVA